MIFKNNVRKRLLCLLLTAVMLLGVSFTGVTASAATTPTSIGMAAHGIKAHRDGWKYVYGGKGQKYGDTRGSDCAGLLYAYFSDCKALGNMQGGASKQVSVNCCFSNDLSEGIPNIHGLAITKPDYYDPGTGLYGHIGIYIGGYETVDNSDTIRNMRRDPLSNTARGWTAWHLFDNGMMYPVNGWYPLDGKMVHYTNYEYDAETYVDGWYVDSAGYALTTAGDFADPSNFEESTEYVSASKVAAYLKTRFSGKDSTYEYIYGVSPGETSTHNAKVTASSVNIRASANTTSSIIAVLPNGAVLDIDSETTGEVITNDGKTTDKWYAVTLTNGKNGYVCSLFVKRVDVSANPEEPPPASVKTPTITASGGYVTIRAESGADIYYTIDGKKPTESSTPYTSPVYITGVTYRAVAVIRGTVSPVKTATVLSNDAVFTDFTDNDWFFKAVSSAVVSGIFRGNGDGTISPNQNITRAQFVTALAGLAKVDLGAYDKKPAFPDVSNNGSGMTKAIVWASEKGYVHGYEDGTFRPNAPISREQMCVIIANFAGLSGNDNSGKFKDDGKISSWAKKAVYACRDLGLVAGQGNNMFAPANTAKRCEVCVIMVKLSDKQLVAPPAAEDDDIPPDEVNFAE